METAIYSHRTFEPLGGAMQTGKAKAVSEHVSARRYVSEALERPVGCEPFSTLAERRRSACILIADNSSPSSNALILQPIIQAILAAGTPRASISVLVATGSNHPILGEDLASLVGDPWVLRTVWLANHYARNDDDHIDLGFTHTRRTRVRIDKLFLQADLRIVTGSVARHGAVTCRSPSTNIAPGIAHAQTIRMLQSLSSKGRPIGAHSHLDDNPFHEEQRAIMHMLGEVYGVSTALNEQDDVACVTFGEIESSHAAAAGFLTGYGAARARPSKPMQITAGS
ncbi:lactate racemase domain-containing protein [Rhizobium mongolense]|uniref:lactate racemase domain-containing protein n=1 Tax=Rhizobium mongolense TaxID=57676 RepID=UPI0034A2E4F4